jgi:hypothetical protein
MERKILRKIFGSLKDNGVWRIHTNQELRSVQRSRYYLINWDGKITMVRTCRKNAKRINYEESIQKYSSKKKGPLESQEGDGWTMLKMI